MASNSSSPPVLNPHTPLAFLDPDIATQLQVVGYVYVATFAVCVPTFMTRMRPFTDGSIFIVHYRHIAGIG